MAANEAQVIDSQEFIPLLDYKFKGDDYTLERKREFITGLIRTHTVYRAAAIAGISKKTAYNWYADDPEFAEAWEEALDNSTDNLESSVYEKALRGDTISAIFLLKGYRHKFRDKITIDIEGVMDEITERMRQLGLTEPVVPAMITSGLDSGGSNGNHAQIPVNTDFPHLPDSEQKE